VLEIGIIGAGVMGANHARLAMGLRDARLTVVVDPDESKGQVVAEQVGARHVRRYSEAIDEFDAAIVAVPTPLHEAIVCDLLKSGIHVLVEKPIAASAEEGRRMVEVAAEANRVLMVGHTERFNPAILELDNLVTDPVHVEAQRVSPFTDRIADGVTLDLMIHDLDLLASIDKTDVRKVAAITQNIHGKDDLTVALLGFESGLTASVTASRLGQDKVRQVTITQREDVIRVDLIRQSVTVHRVGRIEPGVGPGFRQSGIVEVPFLSHRGEPLLLELGHFVDCVLKGTDPLVSGEDGIRAVELVDAVQTAAHRSDEVTRV
jgi:predicted dehydrogenase